MNASSSEAEEEKEEHPKVDGEKDPDFSQVSTACQQQQLKYTLTALLCRRSSKSNTNVLYSEQHPLQMHVGITLEHEIL